MKIYENYEVEEKKNRAITIGDFDGVHKGHMALIDKTLEISKMYNYSPSVFTFKFNTANLIQKKVKYIISNDEKFEILKDAKIEDIFVIEYNEEVQRTTTRDFIKDVLVDKLGVKALLLGDDAKLGCDRFDIVGIRHVCESLGVEFYSIPQIQIDGKRVTSSLIRNLISEGVVDEELTKFLGRDYNFVGEVVHGNGQGKKFGFPTANVIVDSDLVMPKYGVYYATCEIDDQIYHSAINIGDKPTVDNSYFGLEVFILDFDRDIYGKKIKVNLKKFIREEEKFESIEMLIIQMNKDVEEVRKYIKNRSNK